MCGCFGGPRVTMKEERGTEIRNGEGEVEALGWAGTGGISTSS